jgi:hypothetical protein
MNRFSLLFCILYFISIGAFGQTKVIDSTSQEHSMAHAVANFYTSLGKQSGLFDGLTYDFYDHRINGSPYFMDAPNTFTPGSVFYNNVPYKNVPMLYDLNKDIVVALLPNTNIKYTLVSDKVQSFDLAGHHFIYFKQDTLNNKTNLRRGFYDRLYNGKVLVLAKRSKTIQIDNLVKTDYVFNSETNYYLKRGGKYYTVNGKGSFINALGDKKKEINLYLKNNHISYSDDPEQAMVKIAAYYDQLTN